MDPEFLDSGKSFSSISNDCLKFWSKSRSFPNTAYSILPFHARSGSDKDLPTLIYRPYMATDNASVQASVDGVTCICQNPVKCAQLHRRFAALPKELGGRRAGFVRVPSEPKAVNTPPSAKSAAKRALKTRRRALTLKHLGVGPKGVAKDARYSRLHIHPSVLALCDTTSGDTIKLPDSIVDSLARKINDEFFSYTNNDRVVPSDPSSMYIPVPNYTLAAAESDLATLEASTVQATKRPKRARTTAATPGVHQSPSASSSSSSSSSLLGGTPQVSQSIHGGGDAPPSRSKRLREATELVRQNPEAAAQKIEALEERIDGLEEFARLYNEERKAHAEAKKRLAEFEASAEGEAAALLQLQLECAGLSRATLTNDEWHAKHPEAAPHLFGFGTWDYTVNYLLALFNDIDDPAKTPPPVDGVHRQRPMSPFEKCLLTKMRIHRG